MSDTNYREIINDDKSLALFLRCMQKFDKHFCNAMASGEDYTLRLELRGDGGRLLHCRVLTDGFERPKGAKRPAERQPMRVVSP
jgi:hypothetical protein